MAEARLHVTDAQGRRVVVLDRPLFLIGRRTAADLQIVSTDVSREHAEIVQEDGRYTLRDRGSRYGTFVNGEQISERALQHGDRIRLGRTDAIELIFATDAAKTTGFLDASSDATNLRQMAAILNGLRALGAGRARACRSECTCTTDAATTPGFLDASSDATNLRQMAAILNGLRALGSGRVL